MRDARISIWAVNKRLAFENCEARALLFRLADVLINIRERF